MKDASLLSTVVAVIAALGGFTGFVALARLWVVDRRAATRDDVQALWAENRKQREELAANRHETDRLDDLLQAEREERWKLATEIAECQRICARQAELIQHLETEVERWKAAAGR